MNFLIFKNAKLSPSLYCNFPMALILSNSNLLNLCDAEFDIPATCLITLLPSVVPFLLSSKNTHSSNQFFKHYLCLPMIFSLAICLYLYLPF